jgi:hypothetical protein
MPGDAHSCVIVSFETNGNNKYSAGGYSLEIKSAALKAVIGVVSESSLLLIQFHQLMHIALS